MSTKVTDSGCGQQAQLSHQLYGFRLSISGVLADAYWEDPRKAAEMGCKAIFPTPSGD